jgi:hypothetical protein
MSDDCVALTPPANKMTNSSPCFLTDTFAHGLDISWITVDQALNSNLHPRPGTDILQPFQPNRECTGFQYVGHGLIVA